MLVQRPVITIARWHSGTGMALTHGRRWRTRRRWCVRSRLTWRVWSWFERSESSLETIRCGRRCVRSFSRWKHVCVDLTRANHCAASGLSTVLRPIMVTVGAWLIAIGSCGRRWTKKPRGLHRVTERWPGAFGHYDLCVRSCQKTPSEGVTALFVQGVINRALASLRPIAEHTRVLVAYVVVLESPLTHLSLIVFIRSSE
jgi:hypothetical protein